ncbi:MAG TPA: hypothetical protein VH540_07410 [Ktedonobacterales bacterium]
MSQDGPIQASQDQAYPILLVNPGNVREGEQITVRGTGWGDCPVTMTIGEGVVKGFQVAQGQPVAGGVRPDAKGEFVVLLGTWGIKPGTHELVVASTRHREPTRLARRFSVDKQEQPRPDGAEEDNGMAHWRARDFFRRRFGHLGFVPPGMRARQIGQVRTLRAQRDKRLRRRLSLDGELDPGQPMPGVCNWTPVGAGPLVIPPGQASAGRTLSIAIDPVTPNTVYIGTANGGVWKSLDSGATWSPKTDYANSLAIGALAIDPNNTARIFAGTGEYNDIGVGTYYGNGLLYSANGGDTWTELATGLFQRVEISRILFDATDTTSQTMFLSSSSGVYQSTDGGVNWTQLRAGSASALVELVNAGPPTTVTLIAAFLGSGIWASTRTGTSWSTWTQISSAAFPTASFGRIALGQSQTQPRNIYAAFAAPGGGGTLVGMAKTTDGGANWSTVTVPASASGQTWYNFYIAVHPSDPNTVYYGERALWKTTTGNGPWTSLPILHSDQHAFTFDPTDPDHTVWGCNDGGVYRSQDGGATWTHRNRDLATLQYISIALHPQWEAIMIGGTQDNGTHRYTGSPAWSYSDGGDGGFTAIDPTTPTRMYHEYTYHTFYRSDTAGTPGSWANKTGAITGAAEFYSPFALDPSNSNTCYFGGDKLWRSPDNADTWTAITNPLIGDITAIAVHPTDSNTIYVATTAGHVYQVQKTGVTWTLPDITTTNLTGADLPANVSLSDLAVDNAGTVWVTVSSVLWTENFGEFSNDHVYRRLASGTSWEARSSGLAQANPINTIVIDPTDSNRLFCGGDVGVFRTEDAGASWTPWDEGIPNVPIFDLEIHNPRRLVRAATHGRSVWERPIDTGTCAMVDLYMRDNILDTGRVQPTPSDQPNPLDPTQRVYWWESVDVKVDAPTPDYQTPTPITSYVGFEAALQHQNPVRGAVNRFYVQVHNRGINTATNIQVRAFFANASAGLPHLPNDFWAAGNPFSGTPSGPDWTPIGPTQTLSSLAAAEPAIMEWDWLVPSSAATHSCLLVVATCTEDVLDGGGILVVDTLVPNRKQVTLKNLHVDDPTPGMPMPAERAYILELHNPYPREFSSELVIDWGSLPRETQLFVALEHLGEEKSAVIPSLEELRPLGIEMASGGEKLFQQEWEDGCGEIRRLDIAHVYRLSPQQGRATTIPGVRLPYNRPRAIALNLILPGNINEGSVRFTVIQQAEKRVIGGSTYVLTPRKRPVSGLLAQL